MTSKNLLLLSLMVAVIFLLGCTQPKQTEYVCWNEQVVLNPEHCPQKEVDTGSSIAGGFCQTGDTTEIYKQVDTHYENCRLSCVNGEWKEGDCLEIKQAEVIEGSVCPGGGWWYDWTTNRCIQTDR